MSSEFDSGPKCNGIFETCLGTAGMAGVLIAIIVAAALVMAIPFTHCTIQQRRQKAAEQRARQERLESIQLQLHNGQPVGDNVRDAPALAGGSGRGAVMSGALPAVDVDAITTAPSGGANGNGDSAAMSGAAPAVKVFGPDGDAIPPAPPVPAHVNPLRQHPVDLESGLEASKKADADQI